MARDPDNRSPLRVINDGSTPERYLDPGNVAVRVAALIALQTYVKFERTRTENVFKIEKKPLPMELLKKLIASPLIRPARCMMTAIPFLGRRRRKTMMYPWFWTSLWAPQYNWPLTEHRAIP